MFHSQFELLITCSGLDATKCIFLRLFVTTRFYSYYSSLFATIRAICYLSLFAFCYSSIFAVRYSRLFPIRVFQTPFLSSSIKNVRILRKYYLFFDRGKTFEDINMFLKHHFSKKKNPQYFKITRRIFFKLHQISLRALMSYVCKFHDRTLYTNFDKLNFLKNATLMHSCQLTNR